MPNTLAFSAVNNLILGIFFSVAIGTWWISQQFSDPPEPRPTTATVPDYWVDKISARMMDTQGQLWRVIGADKLQHFPDTNKSDLINPRMDFLNTNAPAWKVRAKHGWIEPNGETLVLSGLVTVTKDSAPGILPVQVETYDLTVRPKEQYAETNQLVQIRNGLSHVQSQGMQIWLKAPMRIKLLAAVKAHYEIKK